MICPKKVTLGQAPDYRGRIDRSVFLQFPAVYPHAVCGQTYKGPRCYDLAELDGMMVPHPSITFGDDGDDRDIGCVTPG